LRHACNMGDGKGRARAYYDPRVPANAETLQGRTSFITCFMTWVPAYAGMSGRKNPGHPALIQPKWIG
jgi:hypothetical protein